MAKFNLAALIDKIDWQTLDSTRRVSLDKNAIGVCYLKGKRDPLIADQIRIRFGSEVAKTLDWKMGEKISALYDPDDVFSMLLVKREEHGKSLTREHKTGTLMVQFPWKNSKFLLKPQKTNVVEFDIHRGYVHFRLPEIK